MVEVKQTPGNRISQGDIYQNVEHIESIDENDGNLEITKIVFPYVFVLTQDCDLAQDYTFRHDSDKNGDKELISVLVAPLYNSEHVYVGDHLLDLKKKMTPIKKKKTEGTFLRNNQNPRYHYLEFPEDVTIPTSVIDFKHYFSLNVDYLNSIRETNFVCKVSEMYREDISQRFASFLSRIGLP